MPSSKYWDIDFKELFFLLPGLRNEQKISQGGLNVEMNNARDKEFLPFQMRSQCVNVIVVCLYFIGVLT